MIYERASPPGLAYRIAATLVGAGVIVGALGAAAAGTIFIGQYIWTVTFGCR